MILSKTESLISIFESVPLERITEAAAVEVMFSNLEASIYKSAPDEREIAPPEPVLFKSLNVELTKVKVVLPPTVTNPPPLIPPFTRTILIKSRSAAVVKILLLLPSRTMLPDSFAMIVMSFVIRIPFTV